jgi:hypothetical protein
MRTTKKPGEAELSSKESAPELTIKPGNEVTTILLLNMEDAEYSTTIALSFINHSCPAKQES